MKKIYRIFYLPFFLFIFGCEVNLLPTSSVELDTTPIATPDSFAESIEYLSGNIDERLVGMWVIQTSYLDSADTTSDKISDNLYYEWSPEVRIAAANLIGALGEKSQKFTSDLIYVLENDDSIQVKRMVALNLGKIKDPSAIKVLVSNLYNEDRTIQMYSAQSIALITNEKFPEWDSTGGFTIGADGIPLIVKAARDWWKNEGIYENWD